ncbi:MAG: hypothetical protein Q9212_002429, partial [Teloschistes hypoglaucus]
MELSDPATPQPSSSPNDATDRRKSGRVKHKPVLFHEDPNAMSGGVGGKRKRPPVVDQPDPDDLESEESSSDESDGDPDEEELKEKRRKGRPKKTSAKPVAKKSKTTQSKTTTLPVRTATNGVKKPSKPRQPRARPNAAFAEDSTGLFAEIFSQGHTVDAVAAEWITRYDQHNANAMCELVNFVLKCTGCDSKVDIHDIEDPDNATSKLDDLKDEYKAQNITDYPLLFKGKGFANFRRIMTGFFHSLITTAHAAGILYTDLALIENIEIWVTSMSSSAIRPFRHTATVIGLTMESALCTVFAELADSTAKTARQKDGELKKKVVNKQRVASLQEKVNESKRKSDLVDTMLETIFSAVYANRYRDVDPKIRVDCVTALGTWIATAPDKFFVSNYLRYLGWVLSDISPLSRAEVIKQLSILYKSKDDVGRVHAFTEKFRPRFIEMANQDSELNVRVAAVEMLDLIREQGLLEPTDIDQIARLIFDTTPRIRKAVAGFFAENVRDLYESTIEELGGEEGVAEAVGEEEPDDFDEPRKSWLMFKSLAETMKFAAGEDEDGEPTLPQNTETLIIGSEADSRYALAAKAVCQSVSNLEEWEILAGYLLYDSSSTVSNAQEAQSPESLFKARCRLGDYEEMLLLEVLNAAVKNRLLEASETETDKKGKKSRARVGEAQEIQERVALHLAQFVPRLLRKFGANPTTAAIVLRLEHLLNLEIFEQLRQDSTTFAALLDDINKQFLTHVNQDVLTEASNAILHARSFGNLEEVTEGKLQKLWNDTMNALHTLVGRKESGRGFSISALSNTVSRIANLASISDCVSIFETEARSSSSSKKGASGTSKSPAEILTHLISDDYANEDKGSSNELVTASIKALTFYNMWLVRSLRTSLETNIPISTLPDPTPFASALLSVMKTRSSPSTSRIDTLRLAAAGAYLDLHTLYASLRHITPKTATKPSLSKPTTTTTTPPNNKTTKRTHQQQSTTDILHPLIRTIPLHAQTTLLSIFTKAEKDFAKRSRRKLEPAPRPTTSSSSTHNNNNNNNEGVDSAPESDSASSDSNSDVDGGEDEAKKTQSLLAEKRL